MVNLRLELRKLTEKWRLTGEKTRSVATDIPNLLARGHMYGLSDGLDVAASEVDTILDKPGPTIDPLQDPG